MPRLQKGEKKYKYKRNDVIREDEYSDIIDQASLVQYLGLGGKAWVALISIMWVFGKRIGEIVGIRTKNVFVTKSEELGIRFYVLKKNKINDPGILTPFTKLITLSNPYVEPIVSYWKDVRDTEVFLFPRSTTKTGHIYRQYVHTVLKLISPKISSHLFRHTLATRMAEMGATSHQLVSWFDWDKVDTALEYVKRSGKLTKVLTEREW